MTDVNRAWWDERAALHGPEGSSDGVYDVAGFLAGADTLGERELAEVEAAVGEVAGIDLLHIQCHFGMDTLSWARRGANVTGVDFSAVAVARAQALAAEAGLDATFVRADALSLPDDLAGRFDLVFASYGVLCWIASADGWFEQAVTTLRPGGKLVLVDLHPINQMVDSLDPLVVDFPYGGEQPMTFTTTGSYADPDLATDANTTVNHPHGMGEIVTAAARAGLCVDSLTEWLDDDADRRGGVLRQGDDGRFRLPWGDHHLPVTFGLRATKPATGSPDRLTS